VKEPTEEEMIEGSRKMEEEYLTMQKNKKQKTSDA
jgi:hypothetical protein